jgi:hypothetical protein
VEISGRRHCSVSIAAARKGDAVKQKSGSVGHYGEGGSASGERSVTRSRSAAPPDPERPRRILGASVLPTIALMIGRWSQDLDGGAIRCSARWRPGFVIGRAQRGGRTSLKQRRRRNKAGGVHAAPFLGAFAHGQKVVYLGAVQPPQAQGHDQSATRPLFASTYGLQGFGGSAGLW